MNFGGRACVNPKYIFFAVAIWPVTGQGFQNTKWPAVLYSQYISQNRKKSISGSLDFSKSTYDSLD